MPLLLLPASEPPPWVEPIPDNDRIPPVSDLSWDGTAREVLSFLRYPRDWTALRAWAREQRLNQFRLRHALAWLDIRGRATYRDGAWRKIGSGVVGSP
jgi:hypothetical protein